ncbi:MAG: cysteine-rich CWC family protein [Halioglobus sp.]|nr:cysteine-rich CWC family protein [Halioglobus sp.]
MCPLCGADNQCAVAAGRPAETCWCFSEQLDEDAKEKAAAITGAQCVCPACGMPEKGVKS